jgi:hypothetical protein
MPRDGIEIPVDVPDLWASIGAGTPIPVPIVSENTLTSVVATLCAANAR